ncbi:MAG: S9 family peptidase [Melioribacteraceae bacterium]|nr:S9 family peptidase [Melioribacteraceae bacterium]
MKNIFHIKAFTLVVILLSILGCKERVNEAPLIPIEDFFRNPQQTNYTLSPDGKNIAFMQPWNTRMNVFIRNINDENPIQVTFAGDRDIPKYFWGNDKKIMFLQDNKGDENHHLYSVDLDGKNKIDLTPFESTKVWVVDNLDKVENELLIMLNKRDPKIFDVYRININSGELNLVQKNPGNITGWLTDNEGKLRIASTTDGVNTGILYRENEEEDFEPVLALNFQEELRPIKFTYDNKYIYALSNIGRDKLALVKYDLLNNKEIELIYQHPEVDVADVIFSDVKEKVEGVYYKTWKGNYEFFDEDRKILQEYLEDKLEGYEVVLVSRSKDESKFILRTYSDRSLGSFYYYNKRKKEIVRIAQVSPWLNEEQMAKMKPVSYKARDGKTINAYLTFPNVAGKKDLPVVVFPHGGPWIRDYWGFRQTVQFLANRGYVVFQPNYRGSSGYGKKFWQAGFKQWGQDMQNDVTDGVEWLIKQGIADRERIGIMGFSFGGYVSMAGLTLTPDLYNCGVSISGISNLFYFIESIPPYWEVFREMLYTMVGDPEKDKNMFKAYSPSFNVDKIKAPVFIAHGKMDSRINIKESDSFVKKLQKNNVDVTYFVKENEGHGFMNEENRIELHKKIEQFLDKNLKSNSVR